MANFNSELYNLTFRLPRRELPSLVYQNYAKEREFAFELFKASTEEFEHLSEFELPTFAPIRKPIPTEAYDGLYICEKPLSEVGCGIFCLVQGLVGRHDVVTREMMEEIVRVLEEKGYYYPGRGLYWHVFKYFAGHHANHWLEIVDAIEHGNPVTILVKKPENSRNLFVNLVATKNQEAFVQGAHSVKINDPNKYGFITSEGEYISLAKLFEPGFLVTAPWVWPTKI